MRILCPYCGPRGHDEFVYHGDATRQRPDPRVAETSGAFHDYVYLRSNPDGPQPEYWFHAAGCQAWLIVERDTRSHKISAIRPARGAS